MAFGGFDAQSNGVEFHPTEEEIKFLRDSMNELDPSGERRIHRKQAIQFMTKAGLSNFEMRQIWGIANADHNQYLDESQMLIAIRLINCLKNGLPISKQSLKIVPSNPTSNIMRLKQVPKSFPRNMMIPDEETVNSFHNRWLTLQYKSSGVIKGSDVKKKYQNKASKDTLSQIWKICCRTIKGHLTKGQTLMFQHLLNLKKQNVSVTALPEESISLIQQIDSENAYKIKNYSSQCQLQKQNQSKTASPSADIDQIQKFIDLRNQQVNNMMIEVEKIKSEQNNNLNRALDTIKKLKRIIEVQNAQIKELKSTLQNRGQLDIKRSQFVQLCQYMIIQPAQHQYDMRKKKDTPISTNAEVPSQKIISEEIHWPQQQNKVLEAQSQESSETKQIVQLRYNTLKLILQKRPMMPDEMRLIQKRIKQMSYQTLQGYYNELCEKYLPEKANQMNASITSTQKLDIIKNVFGNISLDNQQQEL